MKKIGILSDTHAYWDDRYATFLIVSRWRTQTS